MILVINFGMMEFKCEIISFVTVGFVQIWVVYPFNLYTVSSLILMHLSPVSSSILQTDIILVSHG